MENKNMISKESTDGKAHSRIGASSSGRWMSCPGSVAMAQSAPPSRGSSYAMEGTAAHGLAEICLKEKKKPEDFRGTMIGDFEVNDDMIDAVDVYVNLIRKDSIGRRLTVERSFDMSWLYPGMFGTNDACIEGGSVLRIYDYKHGAGIAVDAVDNSQLVYYALGAAYDEKAGALKQYREIQMIIVQPRAFHRLGPVRQWTIEMADLKRWARRLKASVEMTQMEDAPLFAGDHCRFCPAAGLCPELYKNAQLVAKSDFKTDIPDPRTLTREEISLVVENSPAIEAFLKSAKEIALQTVLAGEKMPGLKLVRMRGSRDWGDAETVRETLLGKYTSEDIFVSKLKTPAQMEKIVGKKTVEELSVNKEGSLTIAPMNDKRKEVILNMALEFSEE